MSNKFSHLATEATQRKEYAMSPGNGLTGNAPIPHDLWRRIIPIVREYDKANVSIAQLYSYLLAYVNGNKENNRYMSAFPSVDKIAEETGIGRNRIAKLSNVLVAGGLIKTAYDYMTNKRDELYFSMYYSSLTEDEIRRNLDELYC
ncbi:helix-turn-helix domain-containing protein [Bacillus sp. FJAT-51639]|uniref:Helix-turn-helix domain-containing protein n=1 Tax=Bacillus bruguierae TaxID=3127667 RepID=A0ABU8FH32_9BACI